MATHGIGGRCQAWVGPVGTASSNTLLAASEPTLATNLTRVVCMSAFLWSEPFVSPALSLSTIA